MVPMPDDHPQDPGPPGPLMDGTRRRKFTEERAKSRLRDTDVAGSLYKVKAAGWSYAGVVMGLIAGFTSGLPLIGVIIAGLLGGVAVYGLTMLVVSGAGRFSSTLPNALPRHLMRYRLVSPSKATSVAW